MFLDKMTLNKMSIIYKMTTKDMSINKKMAVDEMSTDKRDLDDMPIINKMTVKRRLYTKWRQTKNGGRQKMSVDKMSINEMTSKGHNLK